MFEKFHFRSFEPTSDIMLYANTMLAQVMDHAPDESTGIATLAKIKDEYFGNIEIYSHSERFSVNSQSADPKSAIDQLDLGIKEELAGWRSRRFITEPESSVASL